MIKYILLLLQILSLLCCESHNSVSPEQGNNKEFEHDVERETAKDDGDVDEEKVDNIKKTIKNAQPQQRREYTKKAYESAINKGNTSFLDKMLADDALGVDEHADPNNIAIDASPILQSIKNQVDSYGRSEEEQLKQHKKTLTYIHVNDYIKASAKGALAYALLKVVEGNDNKAEEAALNLLESEKIIPTIGDLKLAIQEVTSDSVVMKLLDRINITSLSRNDKDFLSIRAVNARSVPVLKKLYERDKSIFKEKELYLSGSAYDEAIAKYHRFVSGLVKVTEQEKADSKARVEFFKSLPPEHAVRTSEEIPNESISALKSIMLSMKDPAVSSADIIQSLNGSNLPLQNSEPGFRRIDCVALDNRRYDVFKHLSKYGLTLETKCGHSKFGHMGGYMIESLLRTNCGHEQQYCDAFKIFLVDFLNEHRLDNISDINAKRHAVLKMLIDIDDAQGPEVALALLQKRPGIQKDFYNEGTAAAYVTRLIEKSERKGKDATVLKNILQLVK